MSDNAAPILSREEWLDFRDRFRCDGSCEKSLEGHDLAQREEIQRLKDEHAQSQAVWMNAHSRSFMDIGELKREVAHLTEELNAARDNYETLLDDAVEMRNKFSALHTELAQVKKDLDEPCPTCADATLAEQITALRAELEAVKVDHAGDLTALCFVRSRLIGLRHEACNDELHELSEELTSILSFIDAAISQTAQPEEKREA